MWKLFFLCCFAHLLSCLKQKKKAISQRVKCSISLGVDLEKKGEIFLQSSIASEKFKRIPERKTLVALFSSETLCRSSYHLRIIVVLMHVQSRSAFT